MEVVLLPAIIRWFLIMCNTMTYWSAYLGCWN